MNIAIVAATDFEIESLKKITIETPHTITFFTHGVGLLQATYQLTKLVQQNPDFIIQCGLAGSYSHQLQLTETVLVHSECLADTGAEDHTESLDLFDLGLGSKNEFPFLDGYLLNKEVEKYNSLKHVKSITVNLSAGTTETIRRRQLKYNPDIENMEGACLHYICLQHGIPFMQFRGISNSVEPRNKNNWIIQETLDKCHLEVIKFIQQL